MIVAITCKKIMRKKRQLIKILMNFSLILKIYKNSINFGCSDVQGENEEDIA